MANPASPASESFTVSDTVPASPERLFKAWLDGREHAAMTGGGPAVAEPRVGSAFTAWDGYIRGHTLELDPYRRIVQTWRTTEFTGKHADSKLEIVFDPAPGGTRVTLTHTQLPKGQAKSYLQGWKDYYFKPMKKYFAAQTKREVAAAAAAEFKLPPPPDPKARRGRKSSTRRAKRP